MEHEVATFSQYLIKRKPPAYAQKLYATKVREVETADISPREQRQLAFALAHPASIGLLDGGLALTNPHAELRRRLYIMFALLEVNPEHASHFLPRQRGFLYIFYLGFVGLRAGVKAIAGIFLLKVVIR